MLFASFPYGKPENWTEGDEGHRTIYMMDPALIPASAAARVVYELRQDVRRLNDEVLDLGIIGQTRLLSEARGLLSEDGENPEYDRAIVELVTRLLPRFNHDDHDLVEAMIRNEDSWEALSPEAQQSWLRGYEAAVQVLQADESGE